jgi:hypothetical protein
MEPDEVLRLTQITGLAEMFADKDFTEAWEPDEGGSIIEEFDSMDDLEWGAIVENETPEPGWKSPTDKTRVLYGEDSQRLAVLQKSRFDESWHWYAYLQPLEKGKSETLDAAIQEVEERVG